METIRKQILSLKVELLYRLLRGILKLPDRVFAWLFRLVEVMAIPFVDDEESLMYVRDFKKIFATGPPMSTALRRVILEARPEQLRSTIRGFVTNHLRKTTIWA